MRLVHLSVQRFQCIESAEVDLGPGLNVLYGPNDLGKSSLACAIRAVLLLQHNSSVHERFVSWYGDSEPRVALTLCDDSDRIWRVTKSFASGTAGRSILESSRDGRTFTLDCNGRQVDDKLRTMFGWGIQRPGGAGGPRGLPESFLTQVLLAEQDSVRKVLFETSLADDPDESGRLRLVEALGALAQDPLFKQVLDETLERVGTAFTATGRKKKSVGSPFIEIAEQLKAMQHEHEGLSEKVRETELAEVKIRALNEERDKLHGALAEAEETLTTTRRHFEARQRRARLEVQLENQMATVRNVEALQLTVETSEVEIVRLKVAVEAAVGQVHEANVAMQRDEAARDGARRRLDLLTHDDVEHERRALDLHERKKAAQDRLDESDRAVEQAAAALHLARGIAGELAVAATAALETTRLAKVAGDATSAALAEVGRTQQSHADAAQRARDASSDDRGRARELEQKEIDNRRLTRSAQRMAIERDLQIASEVGGIVEKAAAAKASHGALAAKVETAQEALASEAAKLASVNAESEMLHQLDLYGELRETRGALEAAAQGEANAAQAGEAAAGLRLEESALRGKVRTALPTAEEIVAVRDLREKRKIADARLGGGLSIMVRPKQPIALTAKADGVEVPATSTGEPFVLVANQVLLLGVGDFADIEVTAGEESDRKSAAALRERWSREASRLLEEHNVDTVEQLEALRRDADDALRAADQCARNAAGHEERAARAPSTTDVARFTARLTELEGDLATADLDVLAARFGRLGERWQATLKRQTDEIVNAHKAHVAELDRCREQLTRLQTLLDAQSTETDTLAKDATRRQAGLAESWSVLVDRHQKELAEADRDLKTLEQQAEQLSGGASDDQQAAVQQLAEGLRLLELATERHKESQAAAQCARDAAVKATTKLDGARARARELDVDAVWSSELELPSPALSFASWQDALTAAEELRDQLKVARDAANERLVLLSLERSAAIQCARTAFAQAEKLAINARTRLATLQGDHQTLTATCSQAQGEAAEAKVQLARANVDDSKRAISALGEQLIALESEIGPGSIDARDVTSHERNADRLRAHLREAEEELAKARGGLEQVGGSIVRERLRELDRAIQHARERERQIEIEFDAWKLLLGTLRASESTEGAHLGRALAGPVNSRFRQLTCGRYDSLELGAHLETTGLQAAGDVREISALSAGTQDQLATLLRLCIAEQLHSAIVLDDHLSQSDPTRVAWFNSVLRSAAQQVQIILITCRPAEMLSAEEFLRAGEPIGSGTAGLVRAVDLSSLIRRFASASPESLRSGA